MQFRAEGFNVTNTPHFAIPGTPMISSASFSNGNITALNGYSQITVRNSARASARCKILPLRGAIHVLSYGK